MSKHCVICKRKMQSDPRLRNEDDFFTEEHIFPAGIGGVWVENHLICKRCNSQLGHNADDSICDALRQISTMLNIQNSRTKKWPSFDFEKDGQKFRVIGEEGRITNLAFDAPQLSDDGKYIVATGPRGSEEHIKKSLRGFAKKLGWDVSGQGDPVKLANEEPAPMVPVEVRFNINDTSIRLGVAKIALLALAARISADQAEYIDLTQSFDNLINKRADQFDLTLCPSGTQFFRHHAHAVVFHRLDKNHVGIQVFLYGAITVLLKIDVDSKLPEDSLPSGMAMWPQARVKQDIPNPRWSLGGPDPELGYAALKQAMDEALRIAEMTAAFKRAWTNAGISGQPFGKDLAEEDALQVRQALENELRELAMMSSASDE